MQAEQQGRISPEKAVEILKANGKEISTEEAKMILDFLYKMAKLTVKLLLEV